MARSIYITSAEGDTGKSTIALGLVDLLTRTVTRVGVFRPVARSVGSATTCSSSCCPGTGVDLDYEECVGVTYDEVHHDPEAALSRIVARYHEVERKSDVVVIVGTRLHGRRRADRAVVQRPDRRQPRRAGAARGPRLRPQAGRGALDGRGRARRAAGPARRGHRRRGQPVPRRSSCSPCARRSATTCPPGPSRTTSCSWRRPCARSWRPSTAGS